MAIFALGNKTPRIAASAWIAESAQVIGDVTLADEVTVWFHAVIRADNEPISVGARTNIQDGAVLHNDIGIPLTIGSGVTIGHSAVVHGCTIGDGTLIGIHAVVLNHAVIGKECLIGAHTLIPERKVIPDRSLVVGVPGRIVRTLSDEELDSMRKNAAHYVAAAQFYRQALRRLDPAS